MRKRAIPVADISDGLLAARSRPAFGSCMLGEKQLGFAMHENNVYYAILRALEAADPLRASTQQGRKELHDLTMKIMTAIRDAGIDYVKVGRNNAPWP